MNTSKTMRHFIFIAAVALTAMSAIGCGGGGGGSKKQASAGRGFVSARIMLRDMAARAVGRSAGAATGTVEISFSIEGVYSETNESFPPVVTSMIVDTNTGYAKTSIAQVPTGANHLLTAVAKWPDGQTSTVKCVIKKVTEGETTQAVADSASTIVAEAAIKYAENSGKTLSELSPETILDLESAVRAILSQGIPYGSVTTEQVMDVMEKGSVSVVSVTVTPSSESVRVGEQRQYSAVARDGFGNTLAGASISWSVTQGIGSITSGGLLTASGIGSGSVTATSGSVSGTSALTVAAVCSAHTDCDDSNSATLDSCYAPGTNSAICAHSTSGCNTDANCAPSMPVCVNGGTQTSICVACSSNTNCDDSISLTIDSCVNPGLATSACYHTLVTCNTNDDCGSVAPVCVSGGTSVSACVGCAATSDCNDNNSATYDTCAFAGTAQSMCYHNSDTVRGTVTSGGLPVADAAVRLYNSSYDHTTLTDSTGRYVFTNVPYGTYSLVATKGGMTIYSATATVGSNL